MKILNKYKLIKITDVFNIIKNIFNRFKVNYNYQYSTRIGQYKEIKVWIGTTVYYSKQLPQ